jgi:archaellum component FlaC
MIVGVLFATAVGRVKGRHNLGGQKQLSDISRSIDTLDDRFTRMERLLEVVAIEIERTGEGQRYLTQLLAKGPLDDRVT